LSNDIAESDAGFTPGTAAAQALGVPTALLNRRITRPAYGEATVGCHARGHIADDCPTL
jgi:hypothetical protein